MNWTENLPKNKFDGEKFEYINQIINNAMMSLTLSLYTHEFCLKLFLYNWRQTDSIKF